MFKNLANRLKQFTSCDAGNISMLMGICSIPFMIGAGSAVDFGRYTQVHTDIAVALDAGLMAAAAHVYNDHDVTDADIAAAKSIGLKFFKDVLGPQKGSVIPDPVFSYDKDEMLFTGDVSGKMNTNFLIMAGFTELDLKVNAQAKSGYKRLEGSDLEVSVMLDMSGSMCDYVNGVAQQPCTSGTNVDSLKSAAKELVDAVVWADQSSYTSKVAIVPFSNRVRLEQDGQAGSLFTAVTAMPSTWSGFVGWEPVHVTTLTTKKNCEKKSGHYWQSSKCYKTQGQGKAVTYKAEPCVTERYVTSSSSFGLTEGAPAAGRFNNGSDGTRLPVSTDSAAAPGSFSYNNGSLTNPISTGPSNYSVDGICDLASYYPAGSSKHGYAATDAVPNTNAVVPLTSEKATLKTKIDNFSFQGGTAGMLATSFSWYAISPEWAGIWGTNSAPQPYSKMQELNSGGKPKLYKIAVLMTDGQFNTKWASPTAVSNPDTASETATKAMCDAMKLKDIEIYTVGFNLASNSTSNAMLSYCADDAEHYFDAASTEALKAAFKKIGNKIKYQTAMEIRITK